MHCSKQDHYSITLSVPISSVVTMVTSNKLAPDVTDRLNRGGLLIHKMGRTHRYDECGPVQLSQLHIQGGA
jgi:hypothetical protein